MPKCRDMTQDPTTTNPQKKSYKQTLNLPKTEFAMEAKLTAREPARLEQWREMGLYEKLMKARAGGKKWVLHDGPPFANGDIHLGHLINKTLKDILMRFRSMQGYQTPYVPGWDCHGLPIEHKIQQQLGPKLRELSTVEVRRHCFEYATKYVGLQAGQFQRLGIMGEWDRPYLTMDRAYEASTLEVFAKVVEAGLVYKQLKPVHWSIANQTALADAEIEYQDRTDTSVYVLLEVANPETLPASMNARNKGDGEGETIHLMIWTTTPWTLPANMATAVHPEGEYGLYALSDGGRERLVILGAKLAERIASKGAGGLRRLGACAGSELESAGVRYRHPFIDRISPVVTAEYVTFEDGTGLVHTAPGHGEDDYATGIKKGLEVYNPVLHNGRFDDTVPEWLRGVVVWDANKLIVERLQADGKLYREEPITHSYPHDWRSKTPTIFRATEQWFIALDKPFTVLGEIGVRARSLRQRALDAINAGGEGDGKDGGVEFVPRWGQARMKGMLESRPDWCISRQRAWGLPIPVFYNEKGEALLTSESVKAVGRRFAEKGSDAWFTESPEQLLEGCDTGANFPKDKLRKEKDIFDVWFESGSSWHGVLQAREELQFPADLYLEGSDQHRGWFQLSLLPSLGATGQAPFKGVLAHGFIVKPDGTKVSKSDKEYVTATAEVNRHGADLLRLWCSSVDYQGDVPVSPKVIQEFGDKYRKIRNTLRYLLSNLYDFDPNKDAVAAPARSLDGWAMAELDNLIVEVTAAHEAYQLHKAFRLIHDFCAVQISAIYGNAMKDRLYCEKPDSPIRRRCQTVMHRMVVALTKLLAPVLVFTAEEAWEHIVHKPKGEEELASVHLARWPETSGVVVGDEQREEWRLLMQLRDQALAQLDVLKKEAGLNKAIDAEVEYLINDDKLRRALQAYGSDLEDIAGAGHHTLAESKVSGPPVTVKVIDRRNDYPACARSWKRRPDVGENPAYPDLSLRDAEAVGGEGCRMKDVG